MAVTVQNSQQQGCNPLLLGAGGAVVGAGAGALAGKLITSDLNEDKFLKTAPKYMEYAKSKANKLFDAAISEGKITEKLKRAFNKLIPNFGDNIEKLDKNALEEIKKEFNDTFKASSNDLDDLKDIFNNRNLDENKKIFEVVVDFAKKNNMKKYALIGGAALAAIGAGLAIFSNSKKEV